MSRFVVQSVNDPLGQVPPRQSGGFAAEQREQAFELPLQQFENLLATRPVGRLPDRPAIDTERRGPALRQFARTGDPLDAEHILQPGGVAGVPEDLIRRAGRCPTEPILRRRFQQFDRMPSDLPSQFVQMVVHVVSLFPTS